LKKLTLSLFQELADQRCGKCLSDEYVNANFPLKWECSVGHTWSAVASSVLHGNTWCPECSPFISERICRAYFEAIFDKKFIKTRPKWLKTEKGHSLELDGYCKELGIAFEHQGTQHYLESKQFLKNKTTLRAIQNRDANKRKLCYENKVILIEIPALNYYTKLSDLEQFILNELSKHKITPIYSKPLIIDWKKVYTS